MHPVKMAELKSMKSWNAHVEFAIEFTGTPRAATRVRFRVVDWYGTVQDDHIEQQ